MISAGTVNVGGVVSSTVIILVTGANALPQESVAVHVSTIFPLQKPGTVVIKVDGFEVPFIKQPPFRPLLKEIVLDVGTTPQEIVIGARAVIVGKAAGLTVIVLETEANVLPQLSVAVQVSVTVPPQLEGAVVNVDGFEVPLIAQLPVNPLLNEIVLGAGIEPQVTVVFPGAVIVGNAAGLTVIVLETGAKALPQESVAVQVSVTVPPQAEGVVEIVDRFEVPLIEQPLPNPFENDIVLAAGNEPQATVVAAGAVIVGNSAGLTVIVLETGGKALPQESVAVQVSVTVPPQAEGVVENVEGFEVPLIKQPPLNSFENEIVLGAGNEPQATVVAAGAVIVGKAAGLTVIVLETGAKALPQISVAVHVSVTVPPQAEGVVENVERFEVPLIAHPPLNPLENEIVLGAGNEPQVTVVVAGAVIVGNAAGLTVIVLETGAKALPQESVAVQVSVTVPPQAEGVVEIVDRFEVPLIEQPLPNPFENDIVLAAGNEPQATVVAAGAVIVGNSAGLTVIVLETGGKALPQESVAVQVSVTVPPQAEGVVENVEGFEVPLIKQPPLNSFENEIVLGAGNEPQATVVAAGAVIVGKAAGLIVIVLVLVIVLP